MWKAQLIKALEGKTIKKASFTKFEASDGCIVAQVAFEFTDGSEFDMQNRALPTVHGMLFKSKDDEDSAEVKLI